MRALLEAWKQGETAPPVTTLLGIELVDYEAGAARVRMETESRHFNALGTVHGGILGDLADVAMGAALASVLDEGASFTTVEMHVNYFRPVTRTTLTAAAAVVRRGSKTAYLECEIFDDTAALVAKAASTCMFL